MAYKIMLPLILLSIVFAEFIAASLVKIDQGILNGTVQKSRNGQEFYAFYGIPYAQPPINELRFQPPKLPPPSWQGTKNATQKPPFCPQMIEEKERAFVNHLPQGESSEDCLYLQVYTHNINPGNDTTLKPVLVWFHGGGFSFGGSTRNGPSFFMDKPIVLVGVNSRLGVVGFFSTGEPSYPGNYGLKDQSASLQWIQKNIRAFGGDPSAVTIIGHSSGSTSVHHHTLSPLSKGLIHRAIIQSGTSNMLTLSSSTTDQARRNFQGFKQHTNCSKSSFNASLACLLALPVDELMKFGVTYRDVDSRHFPFNPVIEPEGTEGAFLPTDPNKLIYIDPQMPLIFGFTSNEEVSVHKKHELDNCTQDEKKFDDLLVKEFGFKPDGDPGSLTQKTIALMKEFYFGKNLSNCNYKTLRSIFSDRTFKLPILDAVSNYSNGAYLYEYDYRDSPISQELGVGHGEEMRMLLPYPGEEVLNDEKRKVSETMITYWTNFITTGNPNTPNNTTPTEWFPAKNSSDEYLRKLYISNNGFQMVREFLREKAKLWAHYKEMMRLK